jgi:hypothetical protein
MPSPDTGQAAQVRRYLGQLEGPFSTFCVARILDIPAKVFHWTIHRMQERGEVQKICRGWYQYIGARLNPRPAPMSRRLVKAMYIKGRFSSREIAALSDATIDTAQRVIRRLLKRGDIERIGTRRAPRGHTEAIYRVKDKEKFYLRQKEVYYGGEVRRSN